MRSDGRRGQDKPIGRDRRGVGDVFEQRIVEVGCGCGRLVPVGRIGGAGWLARLVRRGGHRFGDVPGACVVGRRDWRRSVIVGNLAGLLGGFVVVRRRSDVVGGNRGRAHAAIRQQVHGLAEKRASRLKPRRVTCFTAVVGGDAGRVDDILKQRIVEMEVGVGIGLAAPVGQRDDVGPVGVR